MLSSLSRPRRPSRKMRRARQRCRPRRGVQRGRHVEVHRVPGAAGGERSHGAAFRVVAELRLNRLSTARCTRRPQRAEQHHGRRRDTRQRRGARRTPARMTRPGVRPNPEPGHDQDQPGSGRSASRCRTGGALEDRDADRGRDQRHAISDSAAGRSRRTAATETTRAATAEAYTNHLSCRRCSGPEPAGSGRCMETTPARNTNGPTVVAGCQLVASGATAQPGRADAGSWRRSCVGVIAEAAPVGQPGGTAIHTTGRHRGDGGRPSGNGQRDQEEERRRDPEGHGKDPARPGRPGQSGGRGARRVRLGGHAERRHRRPGQEVPAQAVPARTAISTPTSANESVAGMKPNTPVQVTPPVRPSTTFAASSRRSGRAASRARRSAPLRHVSLPRSLWSRAGPGSTPAIRQRYGRRPAGHDEAMSPPSFGAAARILAERDPVIARLVAEAGPPRLSRPAESHFGTLVRAIVYQQLAGARGGRHPRAPGGRPRRRRSNVARGAAGPLRRAVAGGRPVGQQDGVVAGPGRPRCSTAPSSSTPRASPARSDDEVIARLSRCGGSGRGRRTCS